MEIKTLSAVLHDGKRIEAGETVDLDEAIANGLIASGVAEAIAKKTDVKTEPGKGK